MTPEQAKAHVARFGFEPGMRVAYRGGFLRSIGDYSHKRASMRGVVSNKPVAFPHLVDILWDGETETRPCNLANLWPVDGLHLEPR